MRLVYHVERNMHPKSNKPILPLMSLLRYEPMALLRMVGVSVMVVLTKKQKSFDTLVPVPP